MKPAQWTLLIASIVVVLVILLGVVRLITAPKDFETGLTTTQEDLPTQPAAKPPLLEHPSPSPSLPSTDTSPSTSSTSDTIHVTTPTAKTRISSPITVMGEARGNWFFEASFPIELQDANGKRIANTVAQAEADWMTTDFVPFRATLTFSAPATPTGVLILHRDNPSGLPEHDASLRIPVTF